MPRQTPALVLLDACCIINLFATERVEEILSCLPCRFATSRLVATQEGLESLTLLDLLTEREKSDFIRFAAELDEGEASICALAVSRGGGVATDDRKALRLLGQVAPAVRTIQTPELFYDWAHVSRVPEREVTDALRAVRHRARFYPRRDAPRFEWWARHLR
jgi:hypothetical protein